MKVRRDREATVFSRGEEYERDTGRPDWDEVDHSVGEIVGDLTSQVAHLARVEARLAAREVGDKARRGATGGAWFTGAAALAFLALAAFAGGGIAALAMVWPVWLAALVGGVALLLLAGMAAAFARREVRRAMPPVPTETIDRAREDVRAMSGRTES